AIVKVRAWIEDVRKEVIPFDGDIRLAPWDVARQFQLLTYDIGAWIKTENVTSPGAQIVIEWSGPSGWMGGEWKAKMFRGTVEDWGYSSALGVQIPEEATSAIVYLQMAQGSTGTTWFDDVVVERSPKPLMETFVLRPNYRGKVFPGASSPEIEVEVTLHPEEHGLTLEDLEMVAALKRDGALIAQTDLGSLSSKGFKFCLDVPADTPAGDYELFVDLYRAGALREQATYPIEVLSEGDLLALTSYVDAHNRFILNGEPFFPLGLYVAQCSTVDQSSQLNVIQDSPFDTLMNYNVNKCGSVDATTSQISDYLDALYQRNLKLIFRLYDYVSHNPSDIVTLGDKVETFKDHPAVISWHMSEEGGPDGALDYVHEFEARYDTIRELDDNHPVWAVYTRKYVLMGEAHATDILGVDPYPIPNNPITMCSSWADWAKEAGRGYRPLWLVGQIFGWDGRPPTKAEMRAMTYLATNHGAKGLIYYSYFEILDHQGNPDPTQWAAIKEVASEVRHLRDVLLSTHGINENDIACTNTSIDFKLMRKGDTYHLFAVNVEKQHLSDVPFRVNMALESELVDVLFEDGRKVTLNETLMTDDFGPYEVHVYKWQSDADKDGDGFDSAVEWGPDGTDHNYDGNGDGIPDSEQDNAASNHTYDDQHYVTLTVPCPATLRRSETHDNPDPDHTPAVIKEFPYGFFAFDVTGLDKPGDCVEATLFLPKDGEIDTYYRYGPTSDDPNDHWYEFMYDGETGAEIVQESTQTKIVLHLCDGERGDSDLTADGKIVDTGGPASITSAVPTVTTEAASSVASNSAQLNGAINPNGESTTHYFEYGTTSSYGSTTPVLGVVGSGTSPVSVNADITGLDKTTTYHFRLVAENVKGTVEGVDMTFTTASGGGGGGGGGGGCFIAAAAHGPTVTSATCRLSLVFMAVAFLAFLRTRRQKQKA
ncbi:MAG: choice-of-anchor U domain-containing protein, partial [Thermodesulfobacteriota bacterium]|nr:choice-of-anchor U domain-containing protein [Thermodesulfobacteriota bacterium]